MTTTHHHHHHHPSYSSFLTPYLLVCPLLVVEDEEQCIRIKLLKDGRCIKDAGGLSRVGPVDRVRGTREILAGTLGVMGSRNVEHGHVEEVHLHLEGLWGCLEA